MQHEFEMTEGLKRGVKRVFCYIEKSGRYRVIREPFSFRTPIKGCSFDTREQADEWASQFVK